MKYALKDKMKQLAEALMSDTQQAYENGDKVEFFNSLTRLKNGSEALKNLAATAETLAVLESES